jgi:hypothetical protein
MRNKDIVVLRKMLKYCADSLKYSEGVPFGDFIADERNLVFSILRRFNEPAQDRRDLRAGGFALRVKKIARLAVDDAAAVERLHGAFRVFRDVGLVRECLVLERHRELLAREFRVMCTSGIFEPCA